MSNIIVSSKKIPGIFEVWSKQDKGILTLNFNHLLDEFDLRNKGLILLHYRAFPLFSPGWGALDCDKLTYEPDVNINPNQKIYMRLITHPNKNLKVRPTSCCVVTKDEYNKLIT